MGLIDFPRVRFHAGFGHTCCTSSHTVSGFEWERKNADPSPNPPGSNLNMSGHVQLLLSARILGMTFVPEGKVWNYRIIDLTQIPTYRIINQISDGARHSF